MRLAELLTGVNVSPFAADLERIVVARLRAAADSGEDSNLSRELLELLIRLDDHAPLDGPTVLVVYDTVRARLPLDLDQLSTGTTSDHSAAFRDLTTLSGTLMARHLSGEQVRGLFTGLLRSLDPAHLGKKIGSTARALVRSMAGHRPRAGRHRSGRARRPAEEPSRLPTRGGCPDRRAHALLTGTTQPATAAVRRVTQCAVLCYGSPSSVRRGHMYSNVVSGLSGTVVQAGSIEGGVHVQATPELRPVPKQLPALPRGVTGREELLGAIHDALADTECEALRLVVLSGMAGVGKTTVALSWAYRFADRFPDGQLYVDLRGYGPDQPLRPDDVLARFLRALGAAADQVAVDGAERSALFRSLLDQRRMLLVLDNARSEDQVRPLLPGSGCCVVLVTSRNTLTGLVAEQGAALLPVSVLDRQEALDLLRVLVGARIRSEPEAAASLVHSCARLPLALRVVAGLARGRPDATIAELAETLTDEQGRLDRLETGDDARTSVRTVFSWSYRCLPAEAARLFRLLGLVPGPSTGRRAVAALTDTPYPTANRLLETLVRAQLAREVGHRRVAMHDLLRVYAAELAQLTDSVTHRRAAMVRLTDHYLHSAERADRLLTPRRFRIPLEGTPQSVPSLTSYEDALAWMRTEHDSIAALFEATDPVLDSRHWQLAYTMRGYFFLTRDWDTWIRTHRLALAAAVRLGDSAAEAATRNNLGLALLERGSTDAAEGQYLRAGNIFERIGDLRGAGNALGNQAWVLHRRGDHLGALACGTRALANYQRCGAQTNTGITLRDAVNAF